MKRYTNAKVRISEGQKDKLKKAFKSNCRFITIRLTFSDLDGEDVVAITNSQLDRLVETYEDKKCMTIKISKTQLAYNNKVEGRFLLVSAGLIQFLTGTVLRALGVGGVTRTGEHGSTKTNWKCVVSQE